MIKTAFAHLTRLLVFLSNILEHSFKRISRNPWSALNYEIGLILTIAFSITIPLYSEGFYRYIFNTEYYEQNETENYEFEFRYVGSWHGSIREEEYSNINQYIGEQAFPYLNLPVLSSATALSMPNTRVLDQNQEELGFLRIGYASDLFNQIKVIKGALPVEDGNNAQYEAVISLDLANELGIGIDEHLTITYANTEIASVIVSGIWVSEENLGPYQRTKLADSLSDQIVVSEAVWWAIAEKIEKPVDEVAWYFTVQGSEVTTSSAAELIDDIKRIQNISNSILPNTALEVSPLPALTQYLTSTNYLTRTLFLFSVPIFGIVIYFLVFSSNQYVRQQKKEIRLFQSRGAPKIWIVSALMSEWMLLSGLSLLAGIPTGLLFANLLSRTQTFMQFTNAPLFTPILSNRIVFFGIAAFLLSLLIPLVPILRTVNGTQAEKEKVERRITNYSTRLKVFLYTFIAAVIGWVVLNSEWFSQVNHGNRLSPFSNPLVFLVPYLAVSGFSASVVFLLPVLFRTLSSLFDRVKGFLLLFVLKRLSRARTTYQTILFLLMVTFGLATYTSSLAHSYDQNLHDNYWYRYGADVVLVEYGEFLSIEPKDEESGEDNEDEEEGIWNFLPIKDHLGITGINSATRVGEFKIRYDTPAGLRNGVMIGVDPFDFPAVGYYRPDFSDDTLNGLMNSLGKQRNGILVDEKTWEENNLAFGDIIAIRTFVENETKDTQFVVAGIVTLFPTWNPEEDTSLFIANLDYLFESWEGVQPYDVWVEKEDAIQTEQLVSELNEMGVAIISLTDTQERYAGALNSPVRQGNLGILSVGFITSIVLSIVGFISYMIGSLRHRYIQFGIFRAIGLQNHQLQIGLILEFVLLLILGVFGGVLIGWVSAHMFLPMMSIDIDIDFIALSMTCVVPYHQVLSIVLLFLGLASVVLFVLFRFFVNIKIFQAIKLGEDY